MLAKPEYRETNSNVYLTLKNNISLHEKTIHTELMKKIENGWKNYNDTQRRILLYIFSYGNTTLSEIVEHTGIKQNTIRNYLNGFIQDDILVRYSEKKRDIHAKYGIKKILGDENLP